MANDGFDVKPITQLLSSIGITPKELEASGPVGLRLALKGPSNAVVGQVQARLNGVHVNDRRAFKGNVTGELQLSVPTGGASPVRAMRGNGRLEARDGELTNVDLTKRIEQITGLIGMAKEQRDGVTTFKKQGRIVVPLKITGPAKGPSVNVDSQKLATNGLGQLFEERGKGLPVDRLFKSK